MRVGNSFTGEEIKIIAAVLKGIAVRGTDLTSLVRLKSFSTLAYKIHAMAAKAEGAESSVVRKPAAREAVLQAIIAKPGMSTLEIADAVKRAHRPVAYDVTELIREKRIKRYGAGNKQRYWPASESNVVQLPTASGAR